jgi:hypothetical protein
MLAFAGSRCSKNRTVCNCEMKLQSHRFTEANDEDYISGEGATSSMELPMTPSSSTRAAAFVFILLSTMPALAQRALRMPPAHVGPAAHVSLPAAHVTQPGAARHGGPGLAHRPARRTGVFLMPPLPSDEMQSVQDVAAPQQEPADLVIPAIAPQIQSCHRSHVIDLGTAPRMPRMPRVIYGSAMRCAHVQIVETGRMR